VTRVTQVSRSLLGFLSTYSEILSHIISPLSALTAVLSSLMIATLEVIGALSCYCLVWQDEDGKGAHLSSSLLTAHAHTRTHTPI